MGEGGTTRRNRAQPRTTLDRCPRCLLHVPSCLCAELEPLRLATRVVVLRHRKEVHKPTNTGRLVPLTLVGGEIRVFGARDEELDTSGFFDAGRRTLLLYPSPDAQLLARDASDPRPVTLVVPDSDWRRAQKLAQREEQLLGLPRVRLPAGPASSYRLRRHPDPRYLATFEAVARALGILEGPEVQARLEQVFLMLVERVLASRGQSASVASVLLDSRADDAA